MIIQITSLANYDKLVDKFRQSDMWTDMWCEDQVERIRGYIEEHLGEKAWHIINLDNGQICNWPQGTTASIHYKSCDENYIDILDDQLGVVKEYEGYVPNILCPKEKRICRLRDNGY